MGARTWIQGQGLELQCQGLDLQSKGPELQVQGQGVVLSGQDQCQGLEKLSFGTPKGQGHGLPSLARGRSDPAGTGRVNHGWIVRVDVGEPAPAQPRGTVASNLVAVDDTRTVPAAGVEDRVAQPAYVAVAVERISGGANPASSASSSSSAVEEAGHGQEGVVV